MLKFMDQTFCVERIFRFEYETGIYAIKAQNVVHIFNSQVPYICNFALAAAKTRWASETAGDSVEPTDVP